MRVKVQWREEGGEGESKEIRNSHQSKRMNLHHGSLCCFHVGESEVSPFHTIPIDKSDSASVPATHSVKCHVIYVKVGSFKAKKHRKGRQRDEESERKREKQTFLQSHLCACRLYN